MKLQGGNRESRHSSGTAPLITVIVVTYNAANHLQACLNSIFAQEFKNIELLIFDGASSDSTLEIIIKNEDQISYWQSEPDNGIYDAMNKAVKHARGRWLLFLGSDDTLLEGFSLMANKLKETNTLYYGYCLINNKQSNKRLPEYEVAKVNICHQAIFYPAGVFLKYSYDTRYIIYADHALNIQCWGDSSFSKKYFPFPIAKYSLLGFSNKAKDLLFKKEKTVWIRKHSSKWVYYRYLFRKLKESIKGKDDFA
jgi:glycosyltransferase involved in cell wall biosynthesis